MKPKFADAQKGMVQMEPSSCDPTPEAFEVADVSSSEDGVSYRVPWSEVEHLFADSTVSGVGGNEPDPRHMLAGPSNSLAAAAEHIASAERRHAALVKHAQTCRGNRDHPCICGRGRDPAQGTPLELAPRPIDPFDAS